MALQLLLVAVVCVAVATYVRYGVQLMRRTSADKVSFLGPLQGNWCVLVVAKASGGHGQLLFEERGVLVSVDEKRVEIDQAGKTRSFAIGDLRGVKRPNGEVIANWDGGPAREGVPELQTVSDWSSLFSASEMRRRYAAASPGKVRGIAMFAAASIVLAIALRSTRAGPGLVILAILYLLMLLGTFLAKRSR